MLKIEGREGKDSKFTAIKFCVESCIQWHHVQKHNTILVLFEIKVWDYMCY